MESQSNGKRITTIDTSFFYNKPNVVLRFLNGISFPSHRKERDDEFDKKMLLLDRSDRKDTRVNPGKIFSKRKNIHET